MKMLRKTMDKLVIQTLIPLLQSSILWSIRKMEIFKTLERLVPNFDNRTCLRDFDQIKNGVDVTNNKLKFS